MDASFMISYPFRCKLFQERARLRNERLIQRQGDKQRFALAVRRDFDQHDQLRQKSGGEAENRFLLILEIENGKHARPDIPGKGRIALRHGGISGRETEIFFQFGQAGIPEMQRDLARRLRRSPRFRATASASAL